MDLFANLALGFDVAVTWQNLAYCLLGVTVGTLIGILPGLGPVPTIGMLLPITFGLAPESALIMLAGIYYGAQYGGSTAAILVNLPGEASSVVTTIDGYQMAKQGRAGAALAAAALGSFFAGSVATLLIAIAAPPLMAVATSFGPAEYFSLMVLGLVCSILLAQGSLIKGVAMVLLGILLGLIGSDVNSGVSRFTLGYTQLTSGLNFMVIVMGLFAIVEVVRNLGNIESRERVVGKVKGLMPTREDLRRIVGPVLRGTAIGSVLGILPGGGALLSAFAAYSIEKKISAHPERFGKGAIEGVAAPESANNAGAQTSFIPMLTLGIPSSPTMALMIGALMLQGIQPGPGMLAAHPGLFWGIIVSMWVGNLLLVVLNLPLIGIWVRLLTVPYHLLFPAIILLSAIGVYSVSNSTFDIVLMALFGLAGFVLYRLDCEPAPLVLGFILGPLMEEYLRRAMLLSRGDPTVFLTSPISAGLLLVAVAGVLLVVLPTMRSVREDAFQE